jgi:hypothetical protein
MPLKFEGAGLNQGPKLQSIMVKTGQAVDSAVRSAGKTAAEQIEQRGRADIGGAGNFGSNWTGAFKAQLKSSKDGFVIEATMGGGPPVSYWKVFEYGATISANNPSGMLWIPADKSNKAWPRDYGGGLFRKGNALFDTGTKQPIYFGTPSVTIPKKFHLHEICQQVAKELRSFFEANFNPKG